VIAYGYSQMDTIVKENIRTILTKTKLFNAQRNIRLKYHNYFKEYGYFHQKFFQFLSSYDKTLNCHERGIISKHLTANAQAQSLKIKKELDLHGFYITSFSELGIDASATLSFLEDKINAFKPLSHDLKNYKNFNSGKYGDKALSYHLHEKNINQENDPLMALTLHPTLIEIASIYLGYLPMLDFISLVVTPVHEKNQFGAQLWHKDLHHKNSLKIFFSPFELSHDQGPFQFFPVQYSSYKYYRYAPQSMTDSQIIESGLNPKKAISFMGGRDQVLLIDTARCLHRGGCTSKQPRFIATSAYCSPRHSFSSKFYKTTDHFRLSFSQHLNENQYLLKKYSSI